MKKKKRRNRPRGIGKRHMLRYIPRFSEFIRTVIDTSIDRRENNCRCGHSYTRSIDRSIHVPTGDVDGHHHDAFKLTSRTHRNVTFASFLDLQKHECKFTNVWECYGRILCVLVLLLFILFYFNGSYFLSFA
jgi:hypothetical protein